jgi:hypothetical protein
LSAEKASASQSKGKTSVIGWVALGLSALSFLFAVLPGFSFFAWVMIVAAFVVSIVAVAKKGVAKAVPVIALVLSIVAGITAPIVSLMTIGAAISESVDESSATVDEATAKIGDTVSTEGGLNFTVTAVSCGLASAPSWIGGDETPQGEFCKIDFTVLNNGDKEAILFPNYVGGLIGTVEYAANDSASVFVGDSPLSVTINPGLSISGTAFIDVPAGKSIEAITFTEGLLGNEISVLNQ